MIAHLNNEQVDRKKWDEAISRSYNGIVYAYSWYLDIVSPGWNALVKDNYKSIMPLTWRKKYGVTYLYQPFFTQQLGIFSNEKSDAELVQQFLEAIPAQYKFIEINLNTFNVLPKKYEKNNKVKENLTHELDLIGSYDSIEKNYSQNLKRNLKKASAAGLQFISDNRPQAVIKLFRNNRGADISTLKDRDYKTLTHLIHEAIQRGKAQVFTVLNKENELCAGTFFIESNNKVIFLFSGLSEEGKTLGAMPFLIDSFIRHNAGKNVTFDFEGSNDASLARFYKSFGSKECIYRQVKINRLPLPFSLLKR